MKTNSKPKSESVIRHSLLARTRITRALGAGIGLLLAALVSAYADPIAPVVVSPGRIFVTPAGHDLWAIATNRTGTRAVMLDSYQERITVVNADREIVQTISYTEIGAVLQSAGIGVERSGGPAGLRAATAHPAGGWLILIAGPGENCLIRLSEEFTMSVVARGFYSMARGDETGSFPRVAVAGQIGEERILISVYGGVAVFTLDGTLEHGIALGSNIHGIAPEPGTKKFFAIRPNGEIISYADFSDAAGSPEVVAQIPAVNAQDLAFNTGWRTNATSPELVAVGESRVYRVTLDGQTSDTGLGGGHVGVSPFQHALWLAADESGVIDSSNHAPTLPESITTMLTRPFGPILIDALTVAVDEDLDSTHVTSTTEIRGGSVNLVNRNPEFSPDPYFSGERSFVVRIADDFGGESTMLVVIQPPVSNAAPVVETERLEYAPEARDIDLSSRIVDADGDASRITKLLTQSNATAEIVDSTTLRVTSSWSQSGVVEYEVSDIFGSTSTGRIEVAASSRVVAGRFEGIALSAGATDVKSGRVVVTVGTGGRLTGNLLWQGLSLPFTGMIDGGGHAAIRLRGGKITLAIELEFTPAALLKVTVNDRGTEAVGVLRSAELMTANPSPLEGYLTAVLTQDVAYGFSTIRIKKNGRAILAGRLPNGAPFSCSALVRADGTSEFLAAISGRRAMTGTISFTPDTRAAGTNADGALLLSGISTQIEVRGSTWSKPNREAALTVNAGSPNIHIRFSGAGLQAPVDLPATMSARSVTFIGNSSKAKLTVDGMTGLFRGSVSLSGRPARLLGILSKRDNAGFGLWNMAMPGSVEIRPTP